MAPRVDLLRGTLDLLVLQTLALGPNHGVGVARRIQQVTRNRLTPAGRRQLDTATATWERLAEAVAFSAKAAREAKS